MAGLTGAVVWLVWSRVSAADKAADARVAQADTQAELERVRFQLDGSDRSLVAARHLVTVLEQSLAQYINANPNGDLAADAVDERVLRIAREWYANATSGEVRAAGSDAVPGSTATETPGPVLLPD